MSVFVTSIGFGLVTAAVLALAAVGFTLQFAVTNVLNLAYGGVMVVAAYAAYALNHAGVNIWIAALAAIATGAVAVGVSQQRRLHAVPAPRHVADRDGDRRRWA